VALALLFLPLVARAEPQTLQVQVEVVLASSKGTEVDPPGLEKMREAFQRQNFAFTSFKRLSLEVVQVASDQARKVKLPNGVDALLRLVRLQGDTATLKVEVPQLTSVEVELGREGTVYQRGGRHAGGELILALSSPPKP
jgi:hypothetical protein